jgi:hypothetical protein
MESNSPIALKFGVDGSFMCLLGFTQDDVVWLIDLIDRKAEWRCRVKMTPGHEFHIPVSIPIWGVVEVGLVFVPPFFFGFADRERKELAHSREFAFELCFSCISGFLFLFLGLSLFKKSQGSLMAVSAYPLRDQFHYLDKKGFVVLVLWFWFLLMIWF